MSEDIPARIRALEDRDAIRDLIAGYGPLADSGDAEGIAALWVEDGAYAVGGMWEARGHEAIADLIRGPIHQQLMADGCAHLLGPVAIHLDGDHAIARGHGVLLRRQGDANEIFRMSANRWELVRTADGWRVLRRDNALLDGTEAARVLLSLPTGRHPQ